MKKPASGATVNASVCFEQNYSLRAFCMAQPTEGIENLEGKVGMRHKMNMERAKKRKYLPTELNHKWHG